MRGWFQANDRLVHVQMAVRMTRIHRFTDDLDEQAARLGPKVREVVDAYCAGFAAGVARRGWPLLLRAVGIKPGRFTGRKT